MNNYPPNVDLEEIGVEEKHEGYCPGECGFCKFLKEQASLAANYS